MLEFTLPTCLDSVHSTEAGGRFELESDDMDHHTVPCDEDANTVCLNVKCLSVEVLGCHEIEKTCHGLSC
jgi:hypothetical protein